MDITSEDALLCAQPVLAGGPVHPERGFVVHDGTRSWDSTLRIGDDLHVTTSRDVLEAMAAGEGPAHAVVALGCAGWGAGQLEQELADNTWLDKVLGLLLPAGDILYLFANPRLRGAH